MGRVVTAMGEMLGIVLLRFPLIPRIWVIWLLAVNAVGLVFITRIEAQVHLATTVTAVMIMAVIYLRTKFTRLLGAAHVLWVPMFLWMASRTDAIAADPMLAGWVLVLFITNSICLFIDAVDVQRYLRGERAPHYAW